MWRERNHSGGTMTELEAFRQAKDDFFKSHPQSPLAREQRKDFKGLKYFPENDALRFDVPLERYDEPARVTMQTSTGDTQDYLRVGQIRFQVNGQEATL